MNVEHPEYRAKKPMWRRYRDLYTGGEQMKAHASEYLSRRQKEPLDVYGERLERVFYENYVGSIIDWYAATLFRREPEVMVEGDNIAARKFFSTFAEDCDMRGTAISDFFRARLIETLVTGSSHILVDFPAGMGESLSRAEEDAAGLSRAYLVEFSAENLINWSVDARGEYEWVVLRSSHMRTEGDRPGREVIWRRYDRSTYQIWRAFEPDDTGMLCGFDEAGEQMVLVSEGFHALAKQNRVPLFDLRVSEGLWLMNKAGLLQLEHFNKSNALSWALTMGLFATPVVYSDKPWNQIVGESYYIQLGERDRFGWAEPDGKVYQIAAENLTRLQEEIYRVCYVASQALGSQSTVTAQSGLSKLRDFAITQEVLRAYGDTVKDCLKRILRSIEAAREDGLRIDVSGLDDFDIRDFSSDLDDADRLLQLGIESPALKRQVFKRLAFKYLCDVRQSLKDQIAQEIDASISGVAEGKEGVA